MGIQAKKSQSIKSLLELPGALYGKAIEGLMALLAIYSDKAHMDRSVNSVTVVLVAKLTEKRRKKYLTRGNLGDDPFIN